MLCVMEALENLRECEQRAFKQRSETLRAISAIRDISSKRQSTSLFMSSTSFQIVFPQSSRPNLQANNRLAAAEARFVAGLTVGESNLALYLKCLKLMIYLTLFLLFPQMRVLDMVPQAQSLNHISFAENHPKVSPLSQSKILVAIWKPCNVQQARIKANPYVSLEKFDTSGLPAAIKYRCWRHRYKV